MKTAKAEDFKQGTKLIDEENNTYTIIRKYSNGIWEARVARGEVCVFECEAGCYKLG